MDSRPCHGLDLNGERILNLYPMASGVLLADGDEEASVAIPTALVYDLILALHDYKDGDAVPPATEARWKEIAQERGDMLDDMSRRLAEARNALAMIEGADLGEIDVKLIARVGRGAL